MKIPNSNKFNAEFRLKNELKLTKIREASKKVLLLVDNGESTKRGGGLRGCPLKKNSF